MSGKKVDTVVQDIYDTIESVLNGTQKDIPQEYLDSFNEGVNNAIRRAFTPRNKVRKDKTLYFSEVGKPCVRAIWYDLNGYKREPLQPSNVIKFLYGDILEELLILLVKLSDHEVTDEQKAVEIELHNGWKLRGRIDFKIDGTLVDAKSASSYAFKKFSEGSLPDNDPFGYLAQLGCYSIAEKDNSNIGFLAIDKQNGTLTYYAPHETDMAISIPDWELLIDTLEGDTPPPKRYTDKAFGKSGNKCLAIECSYCSHKDTCWTDANGGYGLRKFVYSGKPVFMTDVKREPKVPEIGVNEDEH